MAGLFDKVEFVHGPAIANRLTLAPLTNMQSNPDGSLGDAELHWLEMRAGGGFGITSTCAMHVQPSGQGFAGQLGCFSDDLLPGLTRLADAVKGKGTVAIAQLHHGGSRSDSSLIGGQPICPSDNVEFGAREMTSAEVEESAEAFIAAAERCKKAGFDGVQLHGAHGYLGVRLSPERFGMVEEEAVQFFALLVDSKKVDMIDMSLWSVFKESKSEYYLGQRLIDIFTNLHRGDCRLSVAGRMYNGDDIQAAVNAGADVVAVGRAAITNHDFPNQVKVDPHFKMRDIPVPVEVLRAEGLSDAFIEYMRTWRTFVAE